MAVPAKFRVGYRVRGKHGIRDTDYPDMPLGGWTTLPLDEALDLSIVGGIVEALLAGGIGRHVRSHGLYIE